MASAARQAAAPATEDAARQARRETDNAAEAEARLIEEAKRAERVMLLAGCVIADGAPDAVLRPEHLATAFGGRLLRIDRVDQDAYEGTALMYRLVEKHGLEGAPALLFDSSVIK